MESITTLPVLAILRSISGQVMSPEPILCASTCGSSISTASVS